MKKIILILSATVLTPAQGEVFKCQGTEQKTVYQSIPCPASAVNQQIIEIKKPDPAEAAETEARLKAWQADTAEQEAARRKAQKEQQEALDKQSALDALNRSAAAQEELAETARQPVIINQPLLINPYIGHPRPGNIAPHPDRKRPHRVKRMD